MKRRAHFNDLTGMVFGKITVFGAAPSRADRFVRWHGRCECGTEKTYYGCNLRNGTTKSCGCAKRPGWPLDVEERLIELVRQGGGYHIAARQLAKTRSAISGKVQRLRAEGRI
jgi:hypothetical protein